MDDVEWARGAAESLRDGMVFCREQDTVLPVPILNPVVVPHQSAERVKYLETNICEMFHPVAWPLFVHVASPTLSRYRCRENDEVGVAN